MTLGPGRVRGWGVAVFSKPSTRTRSLSYPCLGHSFFMPNPIEVTYKGARISYSEQTNKWILQLDGEDAREFASLPLARKYVDSPIPFNRIKCWYLAYGRGEWDMVDVTSARTTRDVWIVDSDKCRSKVFASHLYPVNSANDKLIVQLKELHKQTEALEKQAEKLTEQLTCLEVKDEACE